MTALPFSAESSSFGNLKPSTHRTVTLPPPQLCQLAQYLLSLVSVNPLDIPVNRIVRQFSYLPWFTWHSVFETSPTSWHEPDYILDRIISHYMHVPHVLTHSSVDASVFYGWCCYEHKHANASERSHLSIFLGVCVVSTLQKGRQNNCSVDYQVPTS